MAIDPQPPLLVAVLCAAWCRTCVEFAPVMQALAASRPAMQFVSIDIEDEAALCGDLDIEDFPTLAVVRGGAPLHFGPSLPLAGVVARLLDALAASEPDPAASWPPEVRAFATLLAARADESPR